MSSIASVRYDGQISLQSIQNKEDFLAAEAPGALRFAQPRLGEFVSDIYVGPGSVEIAVPGWNLSSHGPLVGAIWVT